MLGGMGLASLALMSSRASAQQTIDLHVPGGPEYAHDHHILSAKGPNDPAAFEPAMARDAVRSLRQGRIHPNDQHYVSWHWANFPGDIDVDSYRLTVRGQVNQTLSLSLTDIFGPAEVSILPRSTNAPALRASISIHALPAANGPMVR